MRSKFQVNKKIVSILFNIHVQRAVISLAADLSVAADLQSDAKYYKDFQSVKQSLSQKSQSVLSTFNYSKLSTLNNQ